MCVRCAIRAAYDGDDHCQLCAFATRIEIARGLRRLDEYLSRWAAFEAWLEHRADAPLARAA